MQLNILKVTSIEKLPIIMIINWTELQDTSIECSPFYKVAAVEFHSNNNSYYKQYWNCTSYYYKYHNDMG